MCSDLISIWYCSTPAVFCIKITSQWQKDLTAYCSQTGMSAYCDSIVVMTLRTRPLKDITGSMYRSRSHSSSASWCSTVCTTKHPSTSSTTASLYPVSPPDNTFALPTEVFSSCLAIVSAVTVGGLFLWPALRFGTGYQTVWETRPSAETPSDVHERRFCFHFTCVHSALELSGRCALQTYLLTYLLESLLCTNWDDSTPWQCCH